MPGGGWTLITFVLLANLGAALTAHFDPYPVVALAILLVIESYALVLISALDSLTSLARGPRRLLRRARERGVLTTLANLGLDPSTAHRGESAQELARAGGVLLLLMLVVVELQALAIQVPANSSKVPDETRYGYGHGYWSFNAEGRWGTPDDELGLFDVVDFHWKDIRLVGNIGGYSSLRTGQWGSPASDADVSMSATGRYAAFRDERSGMLVVFRPATQSLDTLGAFGKIEAGLLAWDEEHRVLRLWRVHDQKAVEFTLPDGGPPLPRIMPGVPPPMP